MNINERFNKELLWQIEGRLPKGHIYRLGMPNDILLSAGIPNLPIELSAERLHNKSIQANHWISSDNCSPQYSSKLRFGSTSA